MSNISPAANAPPGAAAAASKRDARTETLLTAPIGPLLLRLAAPNVVLMMVQQSVGLIEIYWLGRLGTAALTGVTLVFPLLSIMQAMSSGAVGGGMSSAVARALGADRRDDASVLASHSLVIGLVLGLFFMVSLLLGGPFIYRAMGGEGDTLGAALIYSNTVFSGIVLVWLFNAQASVLRGAGNLRLPALVSSAGALLIIPLSPLLIFGLGPFPRLGVAGGGCAVILYYVGGCVVLGLRLASGREVISPRLRRLVLQWRLFREILRVGLVAAMITLTTNLTVMATTAVIGRYGTATIAGYGVGARLEAFLVPLSFSIGAPLVTIVGTCIGAGKAERAVRAAWIAAGISALLAEAIGLLAAGWPELWLGLFSQAPDVLASGHAYLRFVGPFYGFFGLGMTLYFAGQGSGRLLAPVMAGVIRLVIASIGAYLAAVSLGFGPRGAYGALAIGLVCFGGINVIAVLRGGLSHARSE